jgi:hypothetical protein
VATNPLEVLADALHLPDQQDPFPLEAFRRPLTEEIGYAVIGRGTVGLVFAAFLVVALAGGLVLRRSRRPELLGWLAPATAVAAAGAFVALGLSSRRSAVPTVAFGQVVEAAPGTQELAVRGLLAVYRPDSGPAEAGAPQGGLFELDPAGLEGQRRLLVRTDLDAWHWENLALPAGVRFAPFRYTAKGPPVEAVARFGPRGLEGRLAAGPLADPADALLNTPGARNLAVRLHPDGTFRVGAGDALPAGQFLASPLLSDRQQRRQDLYRAFLARRDAQRREAHTVLLAWASPLETHFTLVPDARTVGHALLVVPLRLERPEPDTPVTIPGPLVTCRRVSLGGLIPLTRQSGSAAEMHLRFQVPVEALPLAIDRARLRARIDAPGRRITIAGPPGKPVELHRLDSPQAPLRVALTDADLLRLDEEGGLHLTLRVSEPLAAGQNGPSEKWTIHYIELEIAGLCR